MNLDFASITKRANGTWLFTWTEAEAAYYRIVLFGRELATGITNRQYVYTQPVPDYSAYPPPLELVATIDPAQSEINKPFIVLQWYGIRSNIEVSYYQLQQYNEAVSAWQDGIKVMNNDSFMYSKTTPVLLDGTTYNFRILAVGTDNQVGCALPFRVRMVCCPVLVEPSIAIDYDNDSQAITVISQE